MKRNAIILAAGTSSRFVPLSLEKPKGLLEVKGEILIERQIRQLKEARIEDITIVTGYKCEQFEYLKDLYGVSLVYNEDYNKYNNPSSLIRVVEKLDNTFICSSDNYFLKNPFISHSSNSYYSALYAYGKTNEYCIQTDNVGIIKNVTIGGENEWYMIGHVFLNSDFSKAFAILLEKEYEKEETRKGYWEDLYISHLSELPPMLINRYEQGMIEEFDNLEELRRFDSSYLEDSGSQIMKELTQHLNCKESDLTEFHNLNSKEDEVKFEFLMGGSKFLYDTSTNPVLKNLSIK